MYVQDNEDRQWLGPPEVLGLGVGSVSTLPADGEEIPPRRPVGFAPKVAELLLSPKRRRK